MTTIAPDNANWLYSPYHWHVNGTRAKTIDPFAKTSIMFDGNPGTLAATCDQTNQPAGKTRLSISVDGGPSLDVQSASTIALTVPDNGWSTHYVEIILRALSSAVNRWTSPQAPALLFTGLTTSNTVAPRASRRPPLRLLCAGADSLGEGVSAADDEPTKYEDKNDARLGWAYLLGQMLGAEIGGPAFGGMAWADTAGDLITHTAGVPKIADSLPYLYDGEPRDITTEKPHAVVINLATNDVIRGNSDADITFQVTRLLNWLIDRLPGVPIVIVPGWANQKAAAIAAGIAGCAAPGYVTLVDTTGWWSTADSSDSLHPWGYINVRDLVPRLAAIVRNVLTATGTSRFTKVGNVWVPA